MDNLANRSTVNRLKQIEYQLMKKYDIENFSDNQLVFLTQGILNAAIGETEAIDDLNMPTTMFGVSLDWAAGSTPNDHIVKITRGSVDITQDLLSANVYIPGFEPELDAIYIAAIEIMSSINGDPSILDLGYIETSRTATLTDATTLVNDIIG